jgi:3-deoxy-D-manno-octulosonic-acid transferase
VNRAVRLPYSLAGHLARAAAALSPAGDGKILASLRARRGIRARYAEWGARHRDVARPLLWVHAPSVGEGLQARPVIARLRERLPELQVAYTFYSPSAARFGRDAGADFADYLPFDTAGDARAALDALRPTALVFSKLDVWPLLVAAAAARGIPVGMISATLSQGSARGSGLAALVLRDAYKALSAVGAINIEDAERLAALGVPRERVSVTGDTRYDQVWAHTRAVHRSAGLLGALGTSRSTVVAGSTWPGDEAPLFEAWREVRSKLPGVRLIIAPHEPTPAHLVPIERWAAGTGLSLMRLSDVQPSTHAGPEALPAAGVRPPPSRLPPRPSDADVILVDRVGVLADLYALADVAFVGGGFHSAGLHSVVEPAAFGAPVLFGPRYTASADAAKLVEQGGGFSSRSAPELAMRLLALLSERDARRAAGRKAEALVEAGLGAAERSAEIVESLLLQSLRRPRN